MQIIEEKRSLAEQYSRVSIPEYVKEIFIAEPKVVRSIVLAMLSLASITPSKVLEVFAVALLPVPVVENPLPVDPMPKPVADKGLLVSSSMTSKGESVLMIPSPLNTRLPVPITSPKDLLERLKEIEHE